MNQRSKRGKNGRNKLLRNKNAQKISNWRKETSILAEMGSGPDNGKILQEKMKIYNIHIYKLTNAREIAQLRDNEAKSTS
jgi:superfamily I DNA and/or RNA helicase